MAPRKIQSQEQDHGEEEDDEEKIMETARGLMAKVKKDREVKRKEIQSKHAKQKKDITKKITILFDVRNTKVTKLQKAQWARLDLLNKKRVAIEAQIVASMKSIEQHSVNISNELAAMFVGRKEDLLESLPPTL